MHQKTLTNGIYRCYHIYKQISPLNKNDMEVIMWKKIKELLNKKEKHLATFEEIENYLKNVFPKLPIDSSTGAKKLIKSCDSILVQQK